MRKDVKLGLAIGGVLLALVVIYLTVLPSGNKNTISEAPPPAVTQTPSALDATPLPVSTPALAPASSQPALTAAIPATAPSASAVTPAASRRDWNLLLNDRPTAPTAHRSAGGAESGTLFSDVSPATQATAAAEVSSRVASSAKTYTIKPGDNYSKISTEVYGSRRYYLAIERANPNVDARKLKVGTVISLPDIAAGGATQTEAAAAAPAEAASSARTASVDTASEYVVQSGDSLYKIANKLWGKPGLAAKLYELNKGVIGEDMAKVRVGMVLKLPTAPTQQ